jgi:Rubredoxin-like zinc ribbon domain (DUF35_N)
MGDPPVAQPSTGEAPVGRPAASEAPLCAPAAGDPEAAQFWEACAEGRLEVRRCRACGARFLFPRALCPEGSSPEVEWLVASGRGTVYSSPWSGAPASPTSRSRTS